MVVVEVVIFPLGIAMAWLGIWMIRTPVPAGATEAVS